MPKFLARLSLYFNRLYQSRAIILLLVLHIALWTLTQALAKSNLDRYGDMLENYAWGQVLEWGSFKHPPLFAWVTGLWFKLLPQIDFFYHLLAYFNVALGLLGVALLARAMRLSVLALPAVVLLCLAFPYSTLAAKFNANAVLLSVWPWVALAWWHSLHQTKPSSALLWSLSFGVFAALAMLGKYYSGVLLLSLFIVSWSLPSGRAWLFSWRSWLTLGFFLLCLTPHAYWLQQHEFISLRYVAEQGEGAVAWSQIGRFFLAPVLYWGLPWLLCCVIFSQNGSRWQGLGKRLLQSWMPRSWHDSLFLLAILPWFITLLFGIAGLVELSLPWAIPIGFAYPLLWLRNLCGDEHDAQTAEKLSHHTTSLLKVFLIILLLVPVLGIVQGWREAQRGSDNYYLPRREAAQAILQIWQTRYPNTAAQWVGGAWGENALMAFYGDAQLRILPGVPDQFPATVSPLADWQNRPGLLLCPPTPLDPAAQTACDSEMQNWLAQQGQTEPLIQVTLAREGWRFPLRRAYAYHAYIYWPKSLAAH